MRRLLLLGAIFLGLGGTAQARDFAAGRALMHAAGLAHAADVAPAPCPAGVPVQVITVINQANVRPAALAKVERAMAHQSIQLRVAWGTPCVRFGTGGWPLYLRTGGPSEHVTGPLAIFVATDGLTYQAWSSGFSHEVIETLVDPTTSLAYGTGATGGNLEVADPVEDRAYRLDGTWMSDFVFPNWFAGAHYGDCALEVTYPNGPTPVDSYACPGALIASADALGPYDYMDLLKAPWRTTS